ncbi:MAG: helix-turn-helix domain-containing protein [Phycisphaerae bacterium]|nr:helix-turn-helix domain-containing protein [Phycisphaerae bacterium]
MTSERDLEEPILHRVVPDGCADIIFDLNEHSYREVASIVGTMTKPIFAILKGGINYMAIRFFPGGFSRFFDSAMYNFTDQIIPLETISGKEERNLTEQLFQENHVDNRTRLLERHLENLLRINNRSDPVATNAIYNILTNKGNIKVSELSRIVDTSKRQLRRKFDRWVGVSPKAFCRIIRFRNVLRMVKHDSKCNLLSIALEGGYYDQSHFIHEFNSYYGLNPSEFLRSKNL